jgi:tRNA U34 5-methylaminomethyl-2-thiouridine-forming methyltransferase MnmC
VSAPSASTPPDDQQAQDVELQAQFEAEVRAAGIVVSDEDRQPLFTLWAAQLPIRERLRQADVRLEEEPSFWQKPAQLGGGQQPTRLGGGVS